MTAGILLATSIPPRLSRRWSEEHTEDYQALCVQSWTRAGFRVVSLNAAEEIPPLAARFPEVKFVAAERDARAVVGRRLPYIADMLALLADGAEPVVGIANSDILFEPHGNWAGLQAVADAQTVIVGQRYDTKGLIGGALHKLIGGYDYFFFARGAVNALLAQAPPFAIGLPWWDYWLPLSLALKGWRMRLLERPAAIHLNHEADAVWEARSPVWRDLAWKFVDIIDGIEDAPDGASNLAYLRAYCRDLVVAGRRDETMDDKLIHLANVCIPIIWQNGLRLDDVPSGAGGGLAASAFDGFDIRVEGGAALHEAIKAERKGDIPTAEAQFRLALEKLPHEAGVLLNYGNCLFRQGRLEEATALLQRATERAPTSIEAANRLAAALATQGRNAEAETALERVLVADPSSGVSYFTLALVLAQSGRAAEALFRLDAALAAHPDFPEGVVWRGRIQGLLTR